MFLNQTLINKPIKIDPHHYLGITNTVDSVDCNLIIQYLYPLKKRL